MTTVMCHKLKKEAPALTRAPYPGEIGQRILREISAEAWQLWLRHQTILINEYRLNPLEKQAREFLQKQMEAFLFGEGSATPQQYVPQ